MHTVASQACRPSQASRSRQLSLLGAGKRSPRLQTREQALGTRRRESDCSLRGSDATNCPRMSTEVCSNRVQKQGRVPIPCRRESTTWRQRALWSATLCSLWSTEEFKPPAAWACSDLFFPHNQKSTVRRQRAIVSNAVPW